MLCNKWLKKCILNSRCLLFASGSSGKFFLLACQALWLFQDTSCAHTPIVTEILSWDTEPHPTQHRILQSTILRLFKEWPQGSKSNPRVWAPTRKLFTSFCWVSFVVISSVKANPTPEFLWGGLPTHVEIERQRSLGAFLQQPGTLSHVPLLSMSETNTMECICSAVIFHLQSLGVYTWGHLSVTHTFPSIPCPANIQGDLQAHSLVTDPIKEASWFREPLFRDLTIPPNYSLVPAQKCKSLPNSLTLCVCTDTSLCGPSPSWWLPFLPHKSKASLSSSLCQCL